MVNAQVASAIRGFVLGGGGFIGVGEPSGHQYQGHYFQLASVLGVEKETGFTLGYGKFNQEEHPDHFLLEDAGEPVDFGEGKKGVYAREGAQVLIKRDGDVQLSVNDAGQGRAVYVSGLPYSPQNARLLHRAVMWASHAEDELRRWFSENPAVDVHAYEGSRKYCVVNNSANPQSTTVYRGDGSNFPLEMAPGGIQWFDMD